MKSRLKRIWLVSLILLQLSAYAEAREPQGLQDNPSELFKKNLLSLQFVTGALFAPASWGKDHREFDYVQTNLRLGWMLSDPIKTKYVGTGAFELLLELTNSVIIRGYGSYLRGFTVLGRYNLLLSNPKWVPYFQAGAGIVINDAYKDMTQSSIGQSVEFTPQGSIGLHYFVGRKWAVDVEGMFHHISNAGLAERNRGINAVGGFLGVTYFFGSL
jgi:lipid A 3-O-deacylase